MDRQLPFTADEVALLRALVKPAIVLLLMLRLDRPIGAREIADLLGLEEHTTARYLRSLSRLNLVARAGHRGGYILVGGRQLILGADPSIQGRTVENLQFEPTTTTINTLIVESGSNEGVVVEESARTVEKLQFEGVELSTAVDNFAPAAGTNACPTADNSAAYQALIEAGIGEPKRSSLAARPYMTPLYIKAWEMQLKKEKGERYSPGLLVHVLESGDPHPPVNEIGHPLDCKCNECRQLGYMRCPYCRSYPCECDVDE